MTFYYLKVSESLGGSVNYVSHDIIIVRVTEYRKIDNYNPNATDVSHKDSQSSLPGSTDWFD